MAFFRRNLQTKKTKVINTLHSWALLIRSKRLSNLLCDCNRMTLIAVSIVDTCHFNLLTLQIRNMVYLTEMHKLTILQMTGYGDKTGTHFEVARLFQVTIILLAFSSLLYHLANNSIYPMWFIDDSLTSEARVQVSV